MATRILVLGAGFAGLELCTTLSESVADEVEVTLLDSADAFVFGYSKLDVLFSKASVDAVRLPYADFKKPSIRFRRERILEIDPVARRVVTDAESYEGDILVIAMGADYDVQATPGFDGATEFYSVAGASRMSKLVQSFERGRILVAVCGAPYKCPPAPSEAALLMHDYLSTKGIRGACEITLVLPLDSPVPPSPETSEALIAAFAERDIRFYADREVTSIDPGRGLATFDDHMQLPYDLLLGVPKHRAPQVVVDAGLTEDGYVPTDPRTLKTKFPGVYAVGDCARQGTPKAGVFAEGAARALAAHIVAEIKGTQSKVAHTGKGSCYIEFGAGRIGRVDIDFLSGPAPTGTYHAPSVALRADKEEFGSTRRARWFGRK